MSVPFKSIHTGKNIDKAVGEILNNGNRGVVRCAINDVDWKNASQDSRYKYYVDITLTKRYTTGKFPIVLIYERTQQNGIRLCNCPVEYIQHNASKDITIRLMSNSNINVYVCMLSTEQPKSNVTSYNTYTLINQSNDEDDNNIKYTSANTGLKIDEAVSSFFDNGDMGIELVDIEWDSSKSDDKYRYVSKQYVFNSLNDPHVIVYQMKDDGVFEIVKCDFYIETIRAGQKKLILYSNIKRKTKVVLMHKKNVTNVGVNNVVLNDEESYTLTHSGYEVDIATDLFKNNMMRYDPLYGVKLNVEQSDWVDNKLIVDLYATTSSDIQKMTDICAFFVPSGMEKCVALESKPILNGLKAELEVSSNLKQSGSLYLYRSSTNAESAKNFANAQIENYQQGV